MEQISKRLMNWASILEDNTREQAVTASDDAVHPPAHRADARRPPRQGRDRRLRHPDPRRDHPRRGRRRHRLRDDGRRDRAVRQRPARRHERRCTPRSATPSRSRPASTTQPSTRRAPSAASPSSRSSTAIEQAEAIAPNWRMQLGSLGSGNHFIEVSLDEDNGVWLFLHSGLARRRQQARHEAHQGRPGAVRRSGTSACPTATWPTSLRASRSSGPTWRRCGGRSGSPTSTGTR